MSGLPYIGDISTVPKVAVSVAGTVNALQVTFSPASKAWRKNEIISWVSIGANTTTTPTISKNAGATNITIVKGASVALVAGDIGIVGTIHEGIYNGVNVVLKNPVPSTAGVALLAAANTFTADQALSSPTSTTALTNTTAPGTAFESVGIANYFGYNSASALKSLGSFFAQFSVVTAGSEAMRFVWTTMSAGAAPVTRFIMGQGFYSANATGGDKGTDTINAGALYENGTQIGSAFSSGTGGGGRYLGGGLHLKYGSIVGTTDASGNFPAINLATACGSSFSTSCLMALAFNGDTATGTTIIVGQSNTPNTTSTLNFRTNISSTNIRINFIAIGN